MALKPLRMFLFIAIKRIYLLVVIILFAIGGYFLVEGAMGLGRQKGYQPEQPIYYSHKVHAGTNQISCLYCHGGAQDSKHANIPSVNVCMNCHMAIKEYKGDPIIREDGTTGKWYCRNSKIIFICRMESGYKKI